eukprot:scaffold10349_cov26-Tisochrysis_lutea.AAC.1
MCRAQAGAAGAPGAAPEAVQGGGLSDEELQRKTDSLLEEYASTLDKKEALQCVQELQSPVGVSWGHVGGLCLGTQRWC